MLPGRGGRVWFDGYLGEPTLLIDDFEPKEVGIRLMLRMLDKWPMRLEVKGGVVQPNWTKVIITNNLHPREWYPNANAAVVRAFLARLTVFHAEKRDDLAGASFFAIWAAAQERAAVPNAIAHNIIDLD